MREILSWWIEVLIYGTFVEKRCRYSYSSISGRYGKLNATGGGTDKDYCQVEDSCRACSWEDEEILNIEINCPIKHSDNILTNSIYSSLSCKFFKACCIKMSLLRYKWNKADFKTSFKQLFLLMIGVNSKYRTISMFLILLVSS